MSDTLLFRQDGKTWFAKNSDREPGETQLVVRLPAVTADPQPELNTTYLQIEQVPERHGVILSQPSWLWGAEMGANDQGVVIANTAVFTKVAHAEPALLGADLVRLGLERGHNARAALDVITDLLETYGQGGPARLHDKSFRHDSSFLIADATEAWLLETADRVWVAKRIQHYHALSNTLSIGTEYDLHATNLQAYAKSQQHWNGKKPLHFANTFNSRSLPYLLKAKKRQALTQQYLAQLTTPSLSTIANYLRRHAHTNGAPTLGSNADICMHAAGPIRRQQTTGSMISELDAGNHTHLFTGTSAPCMSIFRPVDFSTETDFHVLFDSEATHDQSLWKRHERLHRRALFSDHLRRLLMTSRRRIEHEIFAAVDEQDLASAESFAQHWQTEQEILLDEQEFAYPSSIAGRYWQKLSKRDGIQP